MKFENNMEPIPRMKSNTFAHNSIDKRYQPGGLQKDEFLETRFSHPPPDAASSMTQKAHSRGGRDDLFKPNKIPDGTMTSMSISKYQNFTRANEENEACT